MKPSSTATRRQEEPDRSRQTSPAAPRLFITGATGFLGRSVLAEAALQGLPTTAVARPAGRGQTLPADAVAEIDLRVKSEVTRALSHDGVGGNGSADGATGDSRRAGVDTVVHLAATKAGDFHTQFAGTVLATENLLDAMTSAGVRNLVAVSTFSVYDYLNMAPGSLVDEQAPIDTSPALRDEYAQTKLIQERLYRDFGRQDGNRVVILRPGMIYGPDNLWHALLGSGFGSRFVRVGSKSTLPMTYVENCAEAIILAAIGISQVGSPLADEVLNIVDDNLPTQEEYARAVEARTETPPTMTVPWAAVNGLATGLKMANQALLDGRAKFPGLLVPDRLHARFKPLRYTNARAKRLLGWTPRFGLIEAIEASVAGRQLRAGEPDTRGAQAGEADTR